MQRFTVTHRIALVVLALITPATEARAAGWGAALFEETGHDFGAVPRGAHVRHRFNVRNTLDQPVTIADVRASCGCTTGRALAQVVPPGQTAVVEAEMDTRNFVGRKATVLYVTLATPDGRQSEVRLNVVSTILADVVLNPGTIDFGTVARGQAPVLTMTIDRVGAPAWKLTKMVSSCRSIDASLTETARNAQQVSYRLKVSLKADAPAGTLRDPILIHTNDPESPTFPVQLFATIRGDLTATPAVVALGNVISAGAQGKYLVRASKPFAITAIEGAGEGFSLTADNRESRTLHILTVAFRSEETPTQGDLRHAFQVRTDLADEPPLELKATAHLSP